MGNYPNASGHFCSSNTQWGIEEVATQTIQSSASILRRISLSDIEDELVVALRNNLTDRQSRTTYVTETFIGDGSTAQFELTGDLDSKSRHKVMNVSSVKIDGVDKVWITDYLAGYRKSSPVLGKIWFATPPTNNASIVVSYGHTYHFVYPESPRVDLTSNSYPRVSVQLYNASQKEAAIGGGAWRYNITVQITVVDITRDDVDNLIQQIMRYFADVNVRKGFKTFTYIRVSRVTPLVPFGEDPNNVVYAQQVELEIPFEFEYSR